MNTKFTPGPWSVKIDGTSDDMIMRSVFGRDMGGGSEVAIVTTGSYDDETEDANAHLIAAAPDLYAALAELIAAGDAYVYVDGASEVDMMLRFGQAIAAARAALAKARGQ